MINKKDEPKQGFMSSEETKKLVLAFAAGRGKQGITEAETIKIIKWAENIRLNESMLGLILDGDILVNCADTELENFEDVTLTSAKAAMPPDEFIAYKQAFKTIKNEINDARH